MPISRIGTDGIENGAVVPADLSTGGPSWTSSGNLTVIGTVNTPATFGFKNRIINGAMVIDQRNNGASVTPTADPTYTLDRWAVGLSAASKFSVQQNAGSVTPPTGFRNYLGITSLSAYSVAAGDYFTVQQSIEGFNFFDLAWGTASAATVTLSFWVRSSLTGTFGGSFINGAVNRSYPFTYTISAANTWEQKSITVAGDTTGTWATNNTTGLIVMFGLGVGTSTSGPAGAWAGALYRTATGAQSVVGTNGATFYITGVQLEKGSTATSFDYRPYGTELQLCQRYFEKSYDQSVVPGASTINGIAWAVGATVNTFITVNFAVEKRTAPTVSTFGNSGGASLPAVVDGSANISQFGTTQVVPVNNTTTRNATLRISNGSFAGYVGWGYHWIAVSEL